jgi:phospholipid/cholesterol/gamma-HCH transport system permease protein
VGVVKDVITALGQGPLGFIDQAGRLALFCLSTLFWLPRRPFRWSQLFRHLRDVGFGSLFIVVLTGFFTGMVFGFQTLQGFRRFGAEALVGPATLLTLSRELGPVLTGLMVAGRSGSGMATELGTMRVTEQIDALETLAFDPVGFLALPRLLAGIVMLPALVVLANVAAIVSAWITLILATDVRTDDFVLGLRLAFTAFQVVYSLIKATAFGAAIAFVCSYEGYVTGAGAEGVGRSTAKAVVIASVSILVLDAIVAAIFAPFIQA